MLTIHTPIPGIAGRRCVQLLCQQVWHSGVLAGEVNAILMRLEDGSWHKIFFDCGVLFWKAMPSITDTRITDDFHYPCVDLFPKMPVRDCDVVDVTTSDFGGTAELRIRFSGGRVLVLREKADEMEIAYEVYPSA